MWTWIHVIITITNHFLVANWCLVLFRIHRERVGAIHGKYHNEQSKKSKWAMHFENRYWLHAVSPKICWAATFAIDYSLMWVSKEYDLNHPFWLAESRCQFNKEHSSANNKRWLDEVEQNISFWWSVASRLAEENERSVKNWLISIFFFWKLSSVIAKSFNPLKSNSLLLNVD